MADILIRGMEIPSCCLMCPMYTIPGCRVSKRIFPDWMNVAAVPKDCPLVPLPEGHGRLGDLDALSKEFERLAFLDWNQRAAPYSWAYAYSEAQAAVDDSPTIVPAEGGGEDG